jgi:glycosyltransferase involved in cell wall biosynthesis
MKIVIIIPAYNEGRRLGKTLETYGDFFKGKKDDFEILVVLNGCKDNTWDVVKEAMKKNKKIRYIEFEQSGKGFAITEGFKEAIRDDYDLVGFVDADMATPPIAFYELFRRIGNADGAIACRWHKMSLIRSKQTVLRRIMSWGFNFIVRSLFFFPHKDTQCGAKLFRKNLIRKIVPNLGSTEWSYDVDLLFYARRANAKIKSIPTIWEDKRESKLNVTKTPVKMFLSSIRLRLLHSPFNFVVRFYRNVLPKGFKIHNILK